jgi:transposase
VELDKLGFIIIFQDECGLQQDICRESGRIGTDPNNLTKSGKPKAGVLYDQRTAIKHTKTGVISGYVKLPDKEKYLYLAPWTYNDTCDILVFNTWLKEVFIPEVQRLKSSYPTKLIALVLDNVAYHKSQETLDLCNNNGIYLLFQPPYSPDLNPIEPSWNHLKNDVRSKSYDPQTFEDKLFDSINERSW